eukprot:2777255-Alexandrium_andersonii.AAC.1
MLGQTSTGGQGVKPVWGVLPTCPSEATLAGLALNSADPGAAGLMALWAVGGRHAFGGSSGRGMLRACELAACVALRCRW